MNNKDKELIRIDIITAFPAMFDSVFSASIIKIAQEKGLASIFLHNLHDFATDKFHHIDDAPFGGGAGMIIQCEPVFNCIEKLMSERKYDEIIYMSADGELLDQSICNTLSLCRRLIILCGHYKGIDQRIRERLISKEISIGSYVLTGGEIPAMVLIDSIVRLLPGSIGNAESALEDSFQDGLLEPPYYTRPAIFRDMKAPDVLLGGDHKKITEWRMEKAIEKTRLRRKDLLDE